MTRSRRALVVLASSLCLSGATLAVIDVAPAQAWSWSGNYHGIAYGWTENHAWVIASYATVAAQGSGEVASLACGMLSDGSEFSYACGSAASSIVGSLVNGWPHWTNHGIWVALYPGWPSFSWTGGRY